MRQGTSARDGVPGPSVSRLLMSFYLYYEPYTERLLPPTAAATAAAAAAAGDWPVFLILIRGRGFVIYVHNLLE